MVSMDNSWTRSYSFPIQAIFTIVVSLLLYFTVIRQIRAKINSEFIYPVIVEKAEAVNAKVVFSPRRIGIIPVGHDSPRGFGIPLADWMRKTPVVRSPRVIPGADASYAEFQRTEHQSGKGDNRFFLWNWLALQYSPLGY